MSRFSFAKKCALAGAFAAAAAGCSDMPEEQDVGTTDEAIIGGFPASSAKLNAIGTLGVDFSGLGDFSPFCSATLITPTVVLTAEHCVQAFPPEMIAFVIGPDAFHPIRHVAVRGVAAELTVTGGVIGLGSDVAVVHLAEPVTDVNPLAYDLLNTGDVGKRFVGVGYGIQNNNGVYGTRQAGSMTFKGSSGKVFELVFGTFEKFLTDGAPHLFPGIDITDPATIEWLHQFYDFYTVLDGIEGWFGSGQGDAQACFGDSGGPMTAQKNGKTTIFGVTSWGFGSDRLICDFGGAYATINPISYDFIQYQIACPLIPTEGMCQDLTTAVRCATPEEGGYRPLVTDCGELGLICGTDPTTHQIGCVEDPCEGIPAAGTCDGDTAIRCSKPEEGPRRPLSTDCSILGQTCGSDPTTGEIACVDPV